MITEGMHKLLQSKMRGGPKSFLVIVTPNLQTAAQKFGNMSQAFKEVGLEANYTASLFEKFGNAAKREPQ